MYEDLTTYKILVTDEKSPDYYQNDAYFGKIAHWCFNCCPSFTGYEVTDVSDTSLQWDEIAEYTFRNEKDVILFRLKWM